MADAKNEALVRGIQLDDNSVTSFPHIPPVVTAQFMIHDKWLYCTKRSANRSSPSLQLSLYPKTEYLLSATVSYTPSLMKLGTGKARLARIGMGISRSCPMRSTASDLTQCAPSSTSTMDEMLSAPRPHSTRRFFPTSLWSAANLQRPSLSQSSARLTPPLHMLHTPSKRMMGLWSVAKYSALVLVATKGCEVARHRITRGDAASLAEGRAAGDAQDMV
mmetsp:Transcript_14136/g.45094  ORF Transcript_14136/g.45094 Transcript_14136/m.45094 type:complete len:219 (-) Transcript_14136:604-1260(-)